MDEDDETIDVALFENYFFSFSFFLSGKNGKRKRKVMKMMIRLVCICFGVSKLQQIKRLGVGENWEWPLCPGISFQVRINLTKMSKFVDVKFY